MYPDEEYQYSVPYEDEDYAVWIDLKHQVVNIFSSERGLTLHFGCEEFEAFRQNVNNYLRNGINEQNMEVYMDQSILTLHFSHDDLQNFGDMLNGFKLMPRWRIYCHYC